MLKTKIRPNFSTYRGVEHSPRQGFQGFTLAEVLITLGIIGVVAAMTIPTLVANYNSRQWSTAANVFDRKLEEALKTMNTQSTLAGHTTTESFVEELSKHFKTNKICQNDKLLDCFSETVYWGSGDATPEEVDMSKIKKAKNFGQDDWDTNVVGVQFASGVSALIAYNPLTSGDNACTQDPYSNQIAGGDCLAILYDTSGAKNPNSSGKDLRANRNVKKLGATCAFEIDGTCFGVPFPANTTHNWIACDLNTNQSNNAEDLAYMQKYGLSTCLPNAYGGDYYAKAVEHCGGISKIAQLSDLATLANYIYGRTDIGPTTSKSNLTMVVEPTTLGFQYNSAGYVVIWSGSAGNGKSPYNRSIDTTSTSYGNSFRRDFNNGWAVCIE